MPTIILVDSNHPQEVKQITLTPENMLNRECILGRDSRCCVVLDDPQVSNLHGKIVELNGQYYYIDTSRNGSHINNEVVNSEQSYLLKPHDTIQIVNYMLLIQSLGENIPSIFSGNLSVSPSQYMPLATLDTTSLNPWIEGDLSVHCVQVIDETDEVKTFRFVANPPVLFTYKPGQFVTIDLSINGR